MCQKSEKVTESKIWMLRPNCIYSGAKWNSLLHNWPEAQGEKFIITCDLHRTLITHEKVKSDLRRMWDKSIQKSNHSRTIVRGNDLYYWSHVMSGAFGPLCPHQCLRHRQSHCSRHSAVISTLHDRWMALATERGLSFLRRLPTTASLSPRCLSDGNGRGAKPGLLISRDK